MKLPFSKLRGQHTSSLGKKQHGELQHIQPGSNDSRIREQKKGEVANQRSNHADQRLDDRTFGAGGEFINAGSDSQYILNADAPPWTAALENYLNVFIPDSFTSTLMPPHEKRNRRFSGNTMHPSSRAPATPILGKPIEMDSVS
jgi:hypothetical protein